jgi:hypothetical protein
VIVLVLVLVAGAASASAAAAAAATTPPGIRFGNILFSAIFRCDDWHEREGMVSSAALGGMGWV